jgi:two-component system, OmpR family, response regulator
VTHRRHDIEHTRVLLAAGDARTAEFIAKGLGADGHEVVVAADAEVARFLASTEPFDLMIVDLSDAAAPVAELFDAKRGSAGVPVVVLIEGDDPVARRAWEEAGVSAVISRPLDIAFLRACVNDLSHQQAV